MAVATAHVALGALLIVTSGVSCLGYQRTKGCTASPLLPDKPFFVVWNHPTQGCAARGINLNFDRWGIVDNSKDKFIGEQITLLYQLGQFPFFSGKTAYNGGIPQLGNLTSHLLKIESDIRTLVPSTSFSGLGVIDFEAWRPLFYLNYDRLKIYKDKSVQLAKKKFPNYNASQLIQEAAKEFETDGRSFLMKTLQKVSLLRPSGKWGYYGYPRCWDTYCNTSTVSVNDRIAWMYNLSTGLYPSIYFGRSIPASFRASRINQIIHETLRVKALWSAQDTVIFPYTLNQDSAYDLFNKMDLSYSIGEPAEMGSSGVVLWASSSMMHAKNECLVLQDYINTTLGPYVLQLTNFFANCSQQFCQGHGRCVRKDYEMYYQHHLQKSGRTDCLISGIRLMNKKKRMEMPNYKHSNTKNKVKDTYIVKFKTEESKLDFNTFAAAGDFVGDPGKESLSDFDNYICKCFTGWSGIHCEHQIKE